MAENVANVSDSGSGSDTEVETSSRCMEYSKAARVGLPSHKNNVTRRLFDPDNGLPQRPCTAVITPRGRCLPSDVFAALKDTGIDPNALGCLQRKSSGEIILTFRNTYQKAIFLTKCSLTISQQAVAIQDVDHPLTFLNIYDAPHELPDTAIIERLSPYCEVLHHRRGKFREPEGVFNGIRHYRVRILRPIPSYLRFGKTLIVLKHQGQEETCRHCNLPGHYAHSCKEEICFNCDQTGHQAPSCPTPTLCSLCHHQFHKARNCPHSWDRPAAVRVTPATTDQTVDVEQIKSPPHPSTCDFNFFSVLSDDDIPYASATEDQETPKETQPSATTDIQQTPPADQQQQAPQTLPTAVPLQDTHESPTDSASVTPTESHAKDKTTSTPTDNKQEPTEQDTLQPSSQPDSVDKPLKNPVFQVNIPTRKPTRPTLTTGKPRETTATPGTQQLFADPSSDEESLVEMKDPSAFLKRQHEGTPPSHDNTNSPKDKTKNKPVKRSPRKKSAKKGR